MKTLSFIIPAYKAEAFLEKCISSMIISELMDQLEIIVVNDGSPDHTAQIAEMYAQKYPGTIRVLSQENKGHGGALNTGCNAAKGKYLKVIDADDWVLTDQLPLFLSKLAACDSDVVLTHYHTIDITTGEKKEWKTFPEKFDKNYTFSDIMQDWKRFDRCLTFHGITYKTDFYQRQGVALSEHVFYEDHEYATYPACHAQTIMPLDIFIYEYRVGDSNQSVSDENQCKRISHVETVLNKMLNLYGELPENAGKKYAAMKIQGLLLSYWTIALLMYRDRKAGKRLAAKQYRVCCLQAPQVASDVKKKYRILQILCTLHFNIVLWRKLLNTKIYNLVRRNRPF